MLEPFGLGAGAVAFARGCKPFLGELLVAPLLDLRLPRLRLHLANPQLCFFDGRL